MADIIKKTYSFSMTFTNIDDQNQQTVMQGDCVYEKGAGIDVYDMVSTVSNKIKNRDIKDVQDIMDILSTKYKDTGRIVNIQFTYKP